MSKAVIWMILAIAVCMAFILLLEYYSVQHLHAEKYCPSKVTKEPQRAIEATKNDSIIQISRAHIAGHLNYDVWRWIPGFLVDDLRIKRRDFPHYPNVRATIGLMRVEFNEYSNGFNGRGIYGHRMYGLLYPPSTGEYSFIIEMTQVTCACSVEFWLSTSADAMNLRKILAAELPYTIKSTGIVTTPLSYTVQSPTTVRLQSDISYYFEFLEKAFEGVIVTEVKWRVPGGTIFTSIPPSSFAMAVQLEKTGQYVESPMATALHGPLPSLLLQGHRRTLFVGATVHTLPATQLSVLPSCNFKAEYAYEHNITQYTGIREVFESNVYPPDDTWFRSGIEPDRGNGIVQQKDASEVVLLYSNAFEAHNVRGKVVGLHYMEETKNKGNGSRFLLEMDVMLEDSLVHSSEYVFKPANSSVLCHTSNFQWTPNVDVYLVTTLKNLGQWFKHLVENMEDLYAQTHDDHFELVVVDFESQGIDIEYMLETSSLKRWKYIRKTEVFTRSLGLQAGIDSIVDPNSIVMTIDMHLTLPVGFVEYTRRHVVQGKMGYAPMFFRLGPGYTEINVNGFWETLTYGIFALYKSDWTVVGGFNVEKYTKWGGEDWDVLDRTLAKGYEIFRIRHPGLVHYFHTREGLWQ